MNNHYRKYRLTTEDWEDLLPKETDVEFLKKTLKKEKRKKLRRLLQRRIKQLDQPS